MIDLLLKAAEQHTNIRSQSIMDDHRIKIISVNSSIIDQSETGKQIHEISASEMNEIIFALYDVPPELSRKSMISDGSESYEITLMFSMRGILGRVYKKIHSSKKIGTPICTFEYGGSDLTREDLHSTLREIDAIVGKYYHAIWSAPEIRSLLPTIAPLIRSADEYQSEYPTNELHSIHCSALNRISSIMEKRDSIIMVLGNLVMEEKFVSSELDRLSAKYGAESFEDLSIRLNQSLSTPNKRIEIAELITLRDHASSYEHIARKYPELNNSVEIPSTKQEQRALQIAINKFNDSLCSPVRNVHKPSDKCINCQNITRSLSSCNLDKLNDRVDVAREEYERVLASKYYAIHNLLKEANKSVEEYNVDEVAMDMMMIKKYMGDLPNLQRTDHLREQLLTLNESLDSASREVANVRDSICVNLLKERRFDQVIECRINDNLSKIGGEFKVLISEDHRILYRDSLEITKWANVDHLSETQSFALSLAFQLTMWELSPTPKVDLLVVRDVPESQEVRLILEKAVSIPEFPSTIFLESKSQNELDHSSLIEPVQSSQKIYCDICEVYVSQAWAEKHTTTKKHISMTINRKVQEK